jgi:uncharacterized delta-60 repeat protein
MAEGRVRGKSFRSSIGFGLSLLIAGVLATPANAAPGDLDPSFGEGGIVVTQPGSSPFTGSFVGVSVGPDGGLITAGPAWPRFGIARFDGAGAPDPSFGDGDGVVTHDVGPLDVEDDARTMAIDGSDRIVLGGLANLDEDDGGYAIVARFLSSGAPDLEFGGDGEVELPAGHSVSSLVPDPAGGLIVGGSFGVARVTDAGVLDESYGSEGIALGGSDRLNTTDLAIDTQGRIVAVGIQRSGQSGLPGFAVTRLTPGGDPDPDFGEGDGTTRTEIGDGGADIASAVAIGPDGGPIVAGTTYNTASTPDFATVRYTEAGEPDGTFGEDGIVVTDFQNGASNYGASTLVVPGGVVVAGATSSESESERMFAIARYDAAGNLDSTFGGDGRVTTNVLTGAGGSEFAEDVTMDAAGRLVVAGGARTGSSPTSGVLIRYLAGPVPPIPPDTAIEGLRVWQSRGKVRLNFIGLQGSEPFRFECALDGRAFRRCRSPRTYGGLATGKHVVRVRAIDAAGNVDPTPAHRAFRIKR